VHGSLRRRPASAVSVQFDLRDQPTPALGTKDITAIMLSMYHPGRCPVRIAVDQLNQDGFVLADCGRQIAARIAASIRCRCRAANACTLKSRGLTYRGSRPPSGNMRRHGSIIGAITIGKHRMM